MCTHGKLATVHVLTSCSRCPRTQQTQSAWSWLPESARYCPVTLLTRLQQCTCQMMAPKSRCGCCACLCDRSTTLLHTNHAAGRHAPWGCITGVPNAIERGRHPPIHIADIPEPRLTNTMELPEAPLTNTTEIPETPLTNTTELPETLLTNTTEIPETPLTNTTDCLLYTSPSPRD